MFVMLNIVEQHSQGVSTLRTLLLQTAFFFTTTKKSLPIERGFLKIEIVFRQRKIPIPPRYNNQDRQSHSRAPTIHCQLARLFLALVYI